MQRLKKILIDKSDIAGFINNADLNEKVAKLTTKAESKAEQDKIAKLETHDLNDFLEKSFFVKLVLKICLFINQHLIFYS